MTTTTAELLFIVFQETRFNIGHWVMVRLDTDNYNMEYFDTIDEDPGDKYFNESCNLAMRCLVACLSHKDLLVPDEALFTRYREPVRESSATFLCSGTEVDICRLFSEEMERTAALCHGHMWRQPLIQARKLSSPRILDYDISLRCIKPLSTLACPNFL